ncbi:TIGR03960 family B12-binding radical SAM protein [uncultured Dialister sp.]|jgi:radical SAM family uncharacterized protein|uniref:TIGR03960 family B12-binding radical SAM protein n=1 Tax=uncultured Dialister sp. TaxID=278064 RepID=UPI002631EE98|nr:TIGR03960 family B12-binding radical SAM protein [uncultured Dialister sp.]
MNPVKIDPVWLMHIQKPARYIGGEWNSVVKDHDSVDVKVALAFPDVYEVAMSHLGLKIIYSVLNARDDTLAERVYAPWVDMEALMREKHIPLYTLESKCPVRDFDVLGFTMPFEMCYTNILNMLDLAGIPLLAKDRGEDDPIVVSGGPCVYNAEPVADFFDVFFIGESEEAIGEMAELVKNWKKEGKPGGRKKIIRRMATIKGCYVPSLYQVNYYENGIFRSIAPTDEVAQFPVEKRIIPDFDKVKVDDKPILPHIEIVHDRAVLEMFRGCSRGCRFCQAGMIYRPVREKSEEKLQEIADTLIRNTGYNEISLMSLSSADYSCLPELVDHLLETFKNRRVSVSLPSLRVDSFSIDIAKKIQQVRKSGLTLAPEAGTQRLRDVINKGVTEEDIMGACSNAFKNGWSKVKLYFMMGLPTETDEDLKGIADLAMRIKELYHTIRGRNDCRITVSVASFVPKPFTPFQWMPQCSVEEIERKQQYLKSLFTDRHIKFAYHDAKTGRLEAVLARGDRKLAPVILKAWEKGCKYDSWTEFFDYDRWMEAFEECGVDPDLYASRDRDEYEPEPWDHIDCGVSKDYLRKEWRLAKRGILTHDCRHLACNGCAVCPILDVKPIDHKEENAHEKAVFVYHER